MHICDLSQIGNLDAPDIAKYQHDNYAKLFVGLLMHFSFSKEISSID